MRKIKVRSILPVLATLLVISSHTAVSAEAHDAYYRFYDTAAGEFQTAVAEDVISIASGTTAWTDGNVYTSEGTVETDGAVTVTGNVGLILADGCSLTLPGGIRVAYGSTLTVYAASDGDDAGRLFAYGSDGSAGIGSGGSGMSAGNVIIHGGIIDARGGENGAGIGSGEDGNGGTVTVYGGDVTALGGLYGAGIGGGSDGSGSTVSVYGGCVEAEGGKRASGIGGGYHADGVSITVYGGEVTARGGENGAGIGGGYHGNGGTAAFFGGTVTAYGTTYGAGIGGGYVGDGADVTVRDAHIEAYGGESGGAGIGGGGCPESYAGDGSNGGTLMLYTGVIKASGTNGIGKGAVREGVKDTVISVIRGSTLEDNATHTPIEKTDDQQWIDVLGGTTGVSFTVHPDETIGYAEYDPEIGTYTNRTLSGWEYTRVGENTAAWNNDFYVVSGEVTVSDPIRVTGKVSLILTDGAVLTAPKGIELLTGNTLSIYSCSETGTGALIATGEGDHAGIGGSYQKAGGTLNIHGGHITANGGEYGAGLGGGDSASGGNITIYGGTVTANGNKGAGIGGGNDAGGGTLVIYGGVVEANGGENSAGIGGGDGYQGGRTGGRVTVYGGKVTAKGDGGGAGIGGGTIGNGGTVVINGGEVTAIGGDEGAGIGGGKGHYREGGGNGGSLTIGGGTIHACCGAGAMAIGHGGGNGGQNGSITVSDTVWLKNNLTGTYYQRADTESWFDVLSGSELYFTAEAGQRADYIAYNTQSCTYETRTRTECFNTVSENLTVWNGGYWYIADGETTVGNVTVNGNVSLILRDGCELTVSGGITISSGSTLTVYAQSAGDTMGQLTAIGADGHAGIGGEGTLVLHGGNITAHGGENGAGIGGGLNGNGIAVMIYGGEVTAVGGTNAPRGIGAGYGGNNHGTITCKGVQLLDKASGEPILHSFDKGWIDALDGKTVSVRATALLKVSYLKYGSEEKGICESYTLIDQNTVTLTDGWYVPEGSGTVPHAVTVSGNAHLILPDDCILTAGGIHIPAGSSLTVYAQSEGGHAGKLISNGADGYAGIGGGSGETCGTLTIHGGVIDARGGANGCGIGCAVTLLNGVITAQGGLSGAGIGGNITVTGGTISAKGGENAAGIGSGTVVIRGGTVEAFGGSGGAGIGGGSNQNGVSVSIEGGEVTAYGGENAADIGGGANGNGGTLNFTGGTLTVGGEKSYKAIGAGSGGRDNGSLIIPDDKSLWNNAASMPLVPDFDLNLPKINASVVLVPFVPCTDTLSYQSYNTVSEGYNTLQCNSYKKINKNTLRLDGSVSEWYVMEGVGSINGMMTVVGHVNLLLKDNCSLTVLQGISVTPGNSLTVYAQSNGANAGRLIARPNKSGDYWKAGIGGADPNNTSCGDIIIHGGYIQAKGTSDAAAIGIGSGAKSSGSVTIYGGTVDTRDNAGWSMGIISGPIRIYGGTVYASPDSGCSAPGLGGEIEIYGGLINITGGYGNTSGDAVSGTLTLYGGKVDVKSKGRGISGAVTVFSGTLTIDAEFGSGIRGDFTIHDGTVTAKGYGNAAIGGGDKNIVIHGGTVYAETTHYRDLLNAILGDSVTIDGGSVEAHGHGAPGIKGNTVRVSGGNVTSVCDGFIYNRSYDDVGIYGDITLEGGKLTAAGSGGMAAFGGSVSVPDDVLITHRENGRDVAYLRHEGENWLDVITGTSVSITAVHAEPITCLVYNEEKRAYETASHALFSLIPITQGITALTDGETYLLDQNVTLGNLTVSGDAAVILKDKCMLTVNGNITIADGGSLTVYAQSDADVMGRLYVAGTDAGKPDIGGGTLILHSGNVNAAGGLNAFGIASDLVLEGGFISAKGTERGIGGSISFPDGITALDYATRLTLAQSPNMFTHADVSAWMVPVSDLSTVDYLVFDDETGTYRTETCKNCNVLGANAFTLGDGYYAAYADLSVRHRVTVTGDVHLIIKDGQTVEIGGITVEDGGILTIHAQSEGSAGGTLKVIGLKGNSGVIGKAVICGGNVTFGGAEYGGCGFEGDLTICGGVLNAYGEAAVVGNVVYADGLVPLDLINSVFYPDLTKGARVSVAMLYPSVCDPVTYLAYNTENGKTEKKVCNDHSFVVPGNTNWETGWYTMYDSVTYDTPVTVSGNVNLILKDGCELQANAGIRVHDGYSLTIYAQSEGDNAGKLIASGDTYSAGIGSSIDKTVGEITIHSGNIEAYGGVCGAGIGGGSAGTGGSITICGGSIKAVGDSGGAGIGSGFYDYTEYDDEYGAFSDYGTAGTIRIYGGNVTAIGSAYGAGIGGGEGSDGGSVSIYGGIIYAEGGMWGAAGIGDGMYEEPEYGSVLQVYGGETLICGGDTTAVGGYGASAFNNLTTVIDGMIAMVDDDTPIINASAIAAAGESHNTIRITEAENTLSLLFDGSTFTAVPMGKDAGSGIVTVAVYDGDGRLLEVKVFDPAKEEPQGTFTVSGAYAAAFWWSGADTMKPLCEAVTYSLDGTNSSHME